MDYEKRKEKIKRKVDAIWNDFDSGKISRQEKDARIRAFINSLGKTTGETIDQQIARQLQKDIDRMYGLAPPPEMPESTPYPIEEQIKKEGIPRGLLTDSSIEGMIEPFKSLAILERARRQKKADRQDKKTEDFIRKFEEKLRREGL